MTLMVFFSSRISPLTSTVIFWDRSPRATAVVTWAMLRTWPVRLAAQLSFRAHLAGHSGDLSREGREGVGHAVDGLGQGRHLALGLDGDLLGQVAAGHGGSHLGDVSHLAGEVAGHEVDVVREVLPGARYTLHLGLTAELAFGAHLAGHTGDLVGERGQLVDHD